MATAIDLLMSTNEDVNLLSEESDICTIDAKTRVIFVPSTIIVGGVQSDKNAERIKFSCPKIVGDNLDLSKFSVRINFENVSSVDFNVSIKDQYICDDVAVDGENVTFSWLIGRNAARYMGTVRFIVCAVKTDSDSNINVEWNTAIAEVPVLEGIEIDQPQIGQEEKDVINQLLELTKNTSAEAVQNVNSAKQQAIKDIQSVSQPDITLTVEGGIAEAKATGEAISSLKEDIVPLEYDIYNQLNNINLEISMNKWKTNNPNNTISDDDGVLTVTMNVYAADFRIQRIGAIPNFQKGHTYYAKCEMYTENFTGLGKIYIGDNYSPVTTITPSTWYMISGLVEPEKNGELGFYSEGIAGNEQGMVFKFKNLFLVDVTFLIEESTDLKYFDNYFKRINLIKNEQYLPFLAKKNTLEKRNSGVTIIAGVNSFYKNTADYICSGNNDQLLINDIISKPQVNTIYFTPDSVFDIQAEIKCKTGLSLISDGATFKTSKSKTINIASISKGSLSVTSTEEVYDFFEGMYVELTSKEDPSVWETFYIEKPHYQAKTIKIRPTYKVKNTAKTSLQNNYLKGAYLRNVSSCFSGFNIKDVTIRGIKIDWGADVNVQSPDTYYAQNGFHFAWCENINVENVIAKNGGRHGIMYFDCPCSKIINSTFDKWGEHGIDIFMPLDIEIERNKNIISNCFASKNGMNGLQCHGGSGLIVSNNFFFDNGQYGIGIFGGCNDNIILGNEIRNNEYGGIMIQRASHDIIIQGNTIFGGNYGLLVNGWTDERCVHVKISNNFISDSKKQGIKGTHVTNITIFDNEILNFANNPNGEGTVDGIYFDDAIKCTIRNNTISSLQNLAGNAILISDNDSIGNICQDNNIKFLNDVGFIIGRNSSCQKKISFPRKRTFENVALNIGYINQDGAIVENYSGYSYTDEIPVNIGDIIVSTNSGGKMLVMALYDENHTFVSGIYSGEYGVLQERYLFVTRKGYVRLSYLDKYGNIAILCNADSETNHERYIEISTKKDVVSSGSILDFFADANNNIQILVENATGTVTRSGMVYIYYSDGSVKSEGITLNSPKEVHLNSKINAISIYISQQVITKDGIIKFSAKLIN